MKYLIFSLTIIGILATKLNASTEDCYRVDELIYKDMVKLSQDNRENYVELHRDEIIVIIKGKVLILPIEGEESEAEGKHGKDDNKKS